MKRVIKEILKLNLKQKRKIMFYVFTFPFTIGFILFFLNPFIKSIVFSFNELKLTQSGYILEYVGLDNYNYSLFINTEFIQLFVNTIKNMLIDLPVILAFSFFAAVLLNQKFRGRLLVRVIFFLPVILSAGIVA